MPQLEVHDLHTSYGLSKILFGLSFSVEPGHCVALIGRNGVGKTTTMRSIVGLTPARQGRVLWEETDITRLAPHRIAQLGISYVPEDRRIFPELTVWENLDIARRQGDSADNWAEERVFGLFPDLKDIQSRLGGVLSGGQQQMLTIARALMGNPRMLLLDEPSEGLAPRVIETLRDQVGTLKEHGMSIILAEQNLEFVLALSDHCHILEKGEIRHSGPTAELRDHREIFERYLTL